MPPAMSASGAVGDRRRAIHRGLLRGALGGLFWSLVVGGAVSLFYLNDPKFGGLQGAWSVLFWTMLFWVPSAAAVGAARARDATLSAEHRQILQQEVRRAALQASIPAGAVAIFFIVGTMGYGLGQAIIGASMLLGIWIGSAALVGLGRGQARVRSLLTLEQDLARQPWLDEHLRRWDPNELAAQQRSLGEAVETRFGKLDPRRWSQIQQWDQDRIQEVQRRLDQAGSADELGWND
ncbi:MAG: hypothetical protein U0840_24875 [Gemmataceae bacterium]